MEITSIEAQAADAEERLQDAADVDGAHAVLLPDDRSRRPEDRYLVTGLQADGQTVDKIRARM